MARIDLTGQKFGRLSVIEPSEVRGKRGELKWVCLCDCGEKAVVFGVCLRRGLTKSCGCFKSESSSKRCKVDLTGKKFGRWSVIKESEAKGKRGEIKYLCECDCGSQDVVDGCSLRRGSTKSCGCLSQELTRERNRKDITGEKFGRLTAIRPSEKRSGRGIKWLCECDCGSRTTVASSTLKSGASKSCGCFHREVMVALSGALSPSWNPDLTEEDRTKRRSSPRSFKLAVLEKHGLRCLCCGDFYEDLHHLNGWKDHPLERYKVDNVVPLCSICHKEFHSEYGIKNNTVQQFIQFLDEND